ncbi:hypothetical protein Peur_003739 [Populus x canadensis]
MILGMKATWRGTCGRGHSPSRTSLHDHMRAPELGQYLIDPSLTIMPMVLASLTKGRISKSRKIVESPLLEGLWSALRDNSTRFHHDQ